MIFKYTSISLYTIFTSKMSIKEEPLYKLLTEHLIVDITNIVLIYNDFFTSGSCKYTLIGHTSRITSVAVLLNNNLVSGSWDNSIKIWRNNLVINTLIGHNDCVFCLLVLSNGDLVTGSADTTIKIWRDNKLINTLIGHTKCVTCLAILPGGVLISGSYDKTIKIWKNGKLINSLTNNNLVLSLEVLHNSNLISSSHRTIKIWS